jgi:hypothetical protein
MTLFLNDWKGLIIKSSVKRIEVLTEVFLKICFSWDVTLCHCVTVSAVSDVTEDCSAPL